MKKFNMLFILPLFLGCASSQTSSSKAPKIEGNWQWVETSGGFAGIKKTPESTHEIKHLQINKDSIYFYENGELISTQPYKLQLSKSMISKQMEWKMNESERNVFISRVDSFLIMKEDCYDCFSHKYVKMKEK